MPDLLLELFCEEIPARFQKKAAGDLKKLLTDALVDAGLTYEAAQEYWTPRRLVLDIRGLTGRSADIRDERKGPRVDAPDKAIDGFLRGAGLSSRDEAEIRSDPKKGDFYVAVINKPGREAEDIIAELMPEIIRNFPWPKSMRWGVKSADPGSLRWVRPLQSILCTFGPEPEEPFVVEFEVGGIKSSNITFGHRFHAPDAIKVRRFEDYAASLEKAKVVLSAERRREIILADAKNLAFAQGLELVEDAKLLDEVANLVEWPVVLMGEFDEGFLDIPPEVVQLTIRTNQKCFVLRGSDGALTNRFLLVSNIEASDGGVEIAKGNGKVVAARLADAKFFWESDLAIIENDGFEPWIEKLDSVTFHAKLGSQGERVKRIAALARELADPIAESMLVTEPIGEAQSVPAEAGAKPQTAVSELADKVERAATLAKADLGSAMVYEFPEVQGLMGRYYAQRAGEDASVARAIEEHYKPQGPSDDVPRDPVSIAVALADKLDTLVGFWAIDEKPTGSKDPFALRRAALGVIRLVLENGVRVGLGDALQNSYFLTWQYIESVKTVKELDKLQDLHDESESAGNLDPIFERIVGEGRYDMSDLDFQMADKRLANLLSFFHDRLKVYLRDQGARHDLIDAVLAQSESTSPQGGGGAAEGASNNDDLLMIVRRVEALQKFIETDDGVNLVAGTKRAANILNAEEKKGTEIADAVDKALFNTDEERALFDSLEEAEHFARMAIEKEDFEKAMEFLSRLRAPVDNFFEHVMVNDEDDQVRANRLALMRRIVAATETVADFSKIAG